MDLFDITVIGAGPTGLFGAFYAGLRQMKTKVIEALDTPGGQLSVLYPEKYIYDAPGYPKIQAKDLVRKLLEQTNTFSPVILLDERSLMIRHIGGNIIQIDTDKDSHFTKTLLIAAGIGAFSPNKLKVPGSEELEGKGVFYSARNKSYFNGKRLIIVGGGDSAVDWALNLMDITQEITLIHRRDVFRAHEASVAELLKSPAKVKLFCELKEVHGQSHVDGVTIFNNKTKEEMKLDVDAVLINIGFKADLGPMKDWGVELDGRDIKVNGRMETNLPGVFAAGDIASPTDSVKLNLIATGFSQAAIAVNVAKKRLDPVAPLYEHSSEMKL